MFLDGTKIEEKEKEEDKTPSDPESINEDDCVDASSPKKENDEEAAAIEEFNRICGDYNKPDHHTRFLQSRDSSDDEMDTERPKKKARMSENQDTSDDDATTDDEDEGQDSSSDIERIARVISDAEDDPKGKNKVKKEMEGLTELEMRQRTFQITNEIKRCRKKI